MFAVVERAAADPLGPSELLAHRSLIAASVIMFVFQGTLVGAYYLYYLFTAFLQSTLSLTLVNQYPP